MTNYRTSHREGPAPATPRPARRTLAVRALTIIAPNKILIRGYPLDEMMGRLVVCRSRVSAADGRAADARHRAHAERGAGLVDRPRRDAAVDAGGAQRRDVRRAAQGLRRRRHPRLRPASWRRHRVVHALPRRAASRWSAAARSMQQAADTIVERVREGEGSAAGIRPPLPHARSARRAVVSDGAGARARRRARADDSRRRARARERTRSSSAGRCR